MPIKMTESEAKVASLMQKDPVARAVPLDLSGDAVSQVAAPSTKVYWGRARVRLYGEEMSDDSPTAIAYARGLLRSAKSEDMRSRPLEARYCRWWLMLLWSLSRTQCIEVLAPSGEILAPEQVDFDGLRYAVLGLITSEMLEIPPLPPPPCAEGGKRKR